MCILLRANVFIIVEILPWRALDTREKEPASRHPSSSACACAGGYVTHWERDLVSLDSRRCLGIRVHAHPLQLHWVPMLCFSLLVRKTVSHLRITNTMGRTNRKVFLRSWNWPRWGQGCNSYACECCTEGLCGGQLCRVHLPPSNTLCAHA